MSCRLSVVGGEGGRVGRRRRERRRPPPYLLLLFPGKGSVFRVKSTWVYQVVVAECLHIKNFLSVHFDFDFDFEGQSTAKRSNEVTTTFSFVFGHWMGSRVRGPMTNSNSNKCFVTFESHSSNKKKHLTFEMTMTQLKLVIRSP